MQDERRKRLRFRAWRRGFREIDLILGGFADSHLDALDTSEVEAFEHLLDARDLDVYDWIVGRTPTPAEHDTTLMRKLQAFRHARVDAPPETP